MRIGELGFWWHSVGGPPPARARRCRGRPRPMSRSSARATRACGPPTTSSARARRCGSSCSRPSGGLRRLGTQRRLALRLLLGPAADDGGGARLRALQRAMFATVEEVAARAGRARDRRGHRAAAARSTVALDSAQLARLREAVAARAARRARARTYASSRPSELAPAGAGRGRARRELLAARRAGPSGQAAARPRRGGRGLGVEIYEQHPGHRDRPARACTPHGDGAARVGRARHRGLHGRACAAQRRALVPMNSSMIVTEPLGADAWEQIGWAGGETIGDGAHVYAYLQRTADGRIAIGGRGVPYRYGSRTDGRGDTAAQTVASLHAKLAAMFPAAAGAEIEHAWSGCSACRATGARRRRRPARAGSPGRAATSARASPPRTSPARTLRDLILGESTELTRPALGRHAPRAAGSPSRCAGRHPRRLRALPPRRRRRAPQRAALAPGGALDRRRLAGASEPNSIAPPSTLRRTSMAIRDGAVRHRRRDRDDHAEPARAAQHDRAADAR